MAYLALQPHVGFALVGERPAFLDVRRDRYFALDGVAERGFLEACRSTGHIDPEGDLALRLISTGLFVFKSEPTRLDAIKVDPPDREIQADRTSRGFHPIDLLTVGMLVKRARRQIRVKPLDMVLDQRRRRRSPNLASSDIEALAARFRRARSLVPIQPTCLQDSLALYDWLSVRKASAAIVFGVKLDPFAAHCWIQFGRTVLNDAPDRVREFTPILVVP